MSKLYTEEEVRDALEMKQYIIHGRHLTNDEIIYQITSIELPTDEEIWDESVEIYPYPNPLTVGLEVGTSMKRSYFTVGAKWMRDKIKGDSNSEIPNLS